MTPDLRHRLACGLAFLTNGAVFGSLLPRYPELKALLELSNTQYGLTVIALTLGGLASAQLPTMLLARRSAPRLGVWSTAAMGLALTLVAPAPSWWVVIAGLFVAGVADAVADTAQNTQAVLVQQALGRSVINRMHAYWSLGSAGAGVISVALARAGVDLVTHLAISGVIVTLAMAVSARLSDHPLPTPPTTTPRDRSARAAPTPRVGLVLAALALMAMTSTLAEDYAMNWATLFFNQVAELPLGLAGISYTIVMGSQFAGRMISDRMDRVLGTARLCLLGCAMVAGGLITVALCPVLWIRLVALVVLGLGCAPLTPTAYAAAGSMSGMSPRASITIMSWCVRAGSLLSSPVLGVSSDLIGLRWAILVPAVFALVGTGWVAWAGRAGVLRRG